MNCKLFIVTGALAPSDISISGEFVTREDGTPIMLIRSTTSCALVPAHTAQGH